MVWQKRYSAPGSSPGLLMPHPKAPARAVVTAIHYTTTAYCEESVVDLQAYLQQPPEPGVLWLNVDGLGEVQVLEHLGAHFGLHMLSLEDVLNIPQRPKFEDFDTYQFLIFRMALTMPDAMGETEQVSLFLGPSYVLTFQERQGGDLFEPVRQRLRQSHGAIRHSAADYLAYALLDAVIDGFFPVLEILGERLENLEEAVLATPTRSTLQEIYALRRTLSALRRSLWPLREAVNAFEHAESTLMTEHTRLFLRDCSDHVLQVMDVLENYRELTNGLMEMYLSSQSHHLNQVMKVLAVISTIFMPLSFLAGIYGMNFNTEKSVWNMPELNWAWGYPFTLGLMLLIALSLLVLFWRKDWL